MSDGQGDLFDVTKNFHNGADTSAAAFQSTTTMSRALARNIVYTEVFASGYTGITCDCVEENTGMSHQTCSARITELVIEGKIRDTGERRKTRSGRTARVYVVVAG